MPSVIDVCNRALSATGTDQTIAHLDERSKEARLCRQWYQPTLEELLRFFAWSFAQKRIALADTGDPPGDWNYRYAYPDDGVYVSDVYEKGSVMSSRRGLDADADRFPFEVGGPTNGGSRSILTNVPDAMCRFTVRIEDPNLMPPDFARALQMSLAANIAMPLVANVKMAQYLYDQAQRALSNAMAVDMNESQEPGNPDADWVKARQVGSRRYDY